MAEELLSQGNFEFVNENYEKALQLYTEAINIDGSNDEAFSCRAQVHLKCDNFEEALKDAEKAIEISPRSSKFYVRKGIALFHLEKYKEAKDAFLKAFEFSGEDSSTTKTWIRKCEAELDLAENKQSESGIPYGTSGISVESCEKSNGSNTVQETKLQAPCQVPKMPVTTKYDWYQTETQVVLTIMLKNVKKEDCIVEAQEQSLSVTIKLPSGNDFSLELDLSNRIIPQNTITKVMSTKVEVKMKKEEAVRWSSLEDDGTHAPKAKQFASAASSDVSKPPSYPTSSKNTRNWDNIAHDIAEEEKNEKLEGDAALNQLFQKIYGDGSDETKRAMLKSFYESGGTVLSTNWKEVGDKKIDVKPPDGMEFKKWDS